MENQIERDRIDKERDEIAQTIADNFGYGDADKYDASDFEWAAFQVQNKGYRKQEWISVEERLPEPNTNVLIYVFFHNQWQIVKGWLSFCDKKFHIANSDYPSLTDIPVTHWMPLPMPPKGDEWK